MVFSQSQAQSQAQSQVKRQTAPPLRPDLPTMYDLPSEDPEEPGLPDEFHDYQPDLLSATLKLQDYAAEEIFTGADINLYYDPDHRLWHKRPDWFLAVGVPPSYNQELRLSYVVWQEPVSPLVVVELLSPGTQAEDFGETRSAPGQPPTKWAVYEQILQIPYYVIYDRYTERLTAFRLEAGTYQQLDLPANRLWIPELKLGLGLWRGKYDRFTCQWLRWYDAAVQWVPTVAERAEVDRQQAEAERQRAEAERQRAESAEAQLSQLQERLREMGIDPDNLTL